MCAMTLATTSAKLLPMRRPEVEKERDMRPAPFRSSKIWSTWRWRICSFHPKRVIQRKSMCDPQKSLHIAAAALLQQLSDMHPVLGHPALLQKTLQAMITDWTVFDQPFFLCKQNFPKLVVCAGKVQCRRPYSSKDIGWNVRFPSSASPLLHYLISKTIYKKIGPVFTTRPTWCG